jgi:hypothetical protein
MSGNSCRSAAASATRLPAALAGVAMLVLAALASATPAEAARAAGQDVPGSQIAADLRTSPLYVDPSLSSAFPSSARTSILAAISRAPAPVFVLAVPLVSGSQWSSSEQLADVVQDELGRPGIYLTLDATESNDIDAYTWPSDPQGLDAPPYHAADAAQAVDLAPYTQNPPAVWQEFLQCVWLIDAGKAESAYQAALADPGPGSQAAAPSSDGGAIAGAAFVAFTLGGAVVITLARRRRRRRRARSQAPLPAPATAADSAYAPSTVVDAARAATAGELRTRAREQLLALGEFLEQPGLAGAAAGTAEPHCGQEEADLTRALDAYTAAGQVLDSASGLPDLAGVLVLTHMGRCAAETALARQSGRPAPPPSWLCFFNPLHGQGTRQTRWRAQGGHQALDVHACAACADALAQRTFPSVLPDTSTGPEIPYYEAPTTWAATGYGQFSTDLIQRILTTGTHVARS